MGGDAVRRPKPAVHVDAFLCLTGKAVGLGIGELNHGFEKAEEQPLGVAVGQPLQRECLEFAGSRGFVDHLVWDLKEPRVDVRECWRQEPPRGHTSHQFAALTGSLRVRVS